MVQIFSPEEAARLEDNSGNSQVFQESQESQEPQESQNENQRIFSPDEVLNMDNSMSPEDYAPASYEGASFVDYLKAVPSTAVDITMGSAEGLASAIGSFTGNYDLARSIGAVREDVNDAIMGDTPSELQSDFAYKLASGVGSTIPFLVAAAATRGKSLTGKTAANAFFLSSAGQQVRDDYLASNGITSETATDEQMEESNKAGAIGAVPVALAERLGAGAILKPFLKGSIPAGQVVDRIKSYAASGLSESITEATQSGLINYIAGYVRKYDENRPITQGMAESALIGFLVGGGISTTVGEVRNKITQADRLTAGIQNGDINAKDVIDPEVGSKLTEVALENNAIPEADTDQQKKITDPSSWKNFVSKTLTPMSHRLGRAGREIVREFRKYEMDTGIKTKEYRDRVADFQKSLQELRKKSPEDYEILSFALQSANELSAPLPNSVDEKLKKKSQTQPNVSRSKSEQELDEKNPYANQINNHIDRAREAMAKRGMKTRIEIVEKGSSYYDPTSNVIGISAKQADGTTVAHEFFHAVLGQAVKTDLELQSMTRNMFDSVIRATVAGSSLNEQLKGFVSQYESNVQNEEFLAQTVGELASQYETLDINTRTRIKVWINQVMQKLGVSDVFKEAATDAEVINQLNAFARFSGKPEVLVEGKVSKDGIDSMVNGGANEEIIGATRASKFSLKDLSEAPRVVFPKKPLRLSRITEKNQFNLAEFLQTAKEQNLNIGFWGADQSGYGTWNNPVTGEDVFIDGGPSWAADPKGGIWAAAGGSKAVKVDYVLQVSGHPEYMAMFNKSINAQFLKNIKKKHGSLKNFAKKYVEVMPESKYMSMLQQKMFEVSIRGDKAFSNPNFYDSLGNVTKEGKDWANTRQTKFWKDVFAQSRQYKIKNPSTNYSEETKVSPLEKLTDGIFPDFSTMRDEFFAENDFKFLDIIGLIKVDGVKKGKSGHSTYPDALTGQYMGVPDIKVSVRDILSPEVIDELQKEAEEAGKKNIPHSKFSGGAGIWTSRRGSDFRTVTADDLQSTDKSLVGKPVVSKADDFYKAAKKLKKKQLPKVRGSVNFKKWMGRGQLVHDDGEPMVLYHGTKEDFTEFRSNVNSDQNDATPNWLFFGRNPELSMEVAKYKIGMRDGKDADDRLQELYEEFNAVDKKSDIDRSNESNEDRLSREDEYVKSKIGVYPEEFEQMYAMSIMPVYLNAKNIWNPRNPDHVRKLYAEISKDKDWSDDYGYSERDISTGNFRYIENPATAKALDDLGFDGAMLMETEEDGLSTVAIWNANGVKSATGNNGDYSLDSNDIRYQKMNSDYLSLALKDKHSKKDKEDMLEMVMEQARRRGYNPLMRLYHGTKKSFNKFESNRDSTGLIYFSTNREFAESYPRGSGGHRKPEQGVRDRIDDAKKKSKAYSKPMWDKLEKQYGDDIPMEASDAVFDKTYKFEKSLLDGMTVSEAEMSMGIRVIDGYIRADEIFDPANWREFKDVILRSQGVASESELDPRTLKLIEDGNYLIWERGEIVDQVLNKYGAMVIQETQGQKAETIAFRDPSRISSADAITYDDQGNVIPLSERFDPTTDDYRYQKERTAKDSERVRGLSDEGLRVLEKYGMTNSYKGVRGVLEDLKDEYRALGLDMNYIDNYFPRLMQDLEGFKASIGQTVGVDEEIRRYENMSGQKMTPIERQKIYEKLARSRMYRGGIETPSNLKERRKTDKYPLLKSELKYYAEPETALDQYIERMVQTIETKKLIGDAQSGRTAGVKGVAGRLGVVMEKMASEGRLRQDQIDVIQGAVAARFGQHGRQYGFVKGAKNAGYLATMGNSGSTLTQLGDFYFTMVQNGLIPTIQSIVGKKTITVEDLGIAKDLVTMETKDGKGFLGKSVDAVFRITGLTAMDRLAKNTNINAAHRTLTKGAKSKQGSKAYEKTLYRLKKIQGNDAYKTIADLKNGVKSDFVIEALYNELADVAPISLTEMPEAYSSHPNLRIIYSLKSYTIKQFNFVRQRSFSEIRQGIATGNPNQVARASVELMRILAFGALANGSADVLKAILFNREINEEDFWWNHFLRIFGITKYTTVQARKEGVGTALTKTILPPQASMLDDIFKDISDVGEDDFSVGDMRTMKYMPIVGKLYYWREGRGVETEEKLSRLRSKD